MLERLRNAVAVSALLAGSFTLPNVVLAQEMGTISTDSSKDPDARADEALKRMTPAQIYRLLQSDALVDPTVAAITKGVRELGIPDIVAADGSIGVRNPARPATALPSSIGMAASWNTDIVNAGGKVIGMEAHSTGINEILGPGLNLTRAPWAGRNFEYFGEDPLLAGLSAKAFIEGLQSQHVMATAKHLALNDWETARQNVDFTKIFGPPAPAEVNNGIISERGQRESDLLAFELALEGKPAAVMCAYGRVNGEYPCMSHSLLSKTLKEDWNFAGYVMTDWVAAQDTVTAATAGVDQESAWQFNQEVNKISGGYFGPSLSKAVEAGQVPQSRIEDMGRRILRSMFAVGLMDHPTTLNGFDAAADAKVAQTAAEEAAVLLKNEDNILPLNAATAKKIAIIGSHADIGVLEGGGAAEVMPIGGNAVLNDKNPRTIPTGVNMWNPSSPLKAIRMVAPESQISFDSGADISAAAALAGRSGAAIVFVHQTTSEMYDQTSLSLPDNQDSLVAAVATANPNTIVVVESGGPILMPWQAVVKAVVEAWYPGSGGGPALANLLFGKTNFSGKLPVTFPASPDQAPLPKAPSTANVNLIEEQNVGYKWYDLRGQVPLYPFGHGLSYTTFAYDNLSITGGNTPKVNFEVSNSGKMGGKEITQIYLGFDAASGEAPQRLVGFAKTDLQANAKSTVSVAIDPRLLAVWNEVTHHWQIKAGTYPVFISSSSRDKRLTGQLVLTDQEWAP